MAHPPTSQQQRRASALATVDPLRWEAAIPGSVLFHGAHVFSGSDVLIVGDSHVLICGAHQAFSDCDVDAVAGRGSSEALRVLDLHLRPRHRVVVFDISTNDIGDPGQFERNLELLPERVGDRELVMVNCWRRDGVNSHVAVNAALDEFVARHPVGTSLIDWAAYVEQQTAALDPQTDRVHFSIASYRRRIELVAAAIGEARGRVSGPGRPP